MIKPERYKSTFVGEVRSFVRISILPHALGVWQPHAVYSSAKSKWRYREIMVAWFFVYWLSELSEARSRRIRIDTEGKKIRSLLLFFFIFLIWRKLKKILEFERLENLKCRFLSPFRNLSPRLICSLCHSFSPGLVECTYIYWVQRFWTFFKNGYWKERSCPKIPVIIVEKNFITLYEYLPSFSFNFDK